MGLFAKQITVVDIEVRTIIDGRAKSLINRVTFWFANQITQGRAMVTFESIAL